MPFALYDATIPLARDALKTMTAILKKAEASPDSAKFPTARLFEDMLPLSMQVYICTDTAQKLYARLSGVEPLDLPRELPDFAAFYARIDEVQALLAKADAALINSRTEEVVPLGRGRDKPNAMIPGSVYAHAYGIPNLMFHLNTTYAILRKEGVPIGKLDYLTAFSGDVPA